MQVSNDKAPNRRIVRERPHRQMLLREKLKARNYCTNLVLCRFVAFLLQSSARHAARDMLMLPLGDAKGDGSKFTEARQQTR